MVKIILVGGDILGKVVDPPSNENPLAIVMSCVKQTLLVYRGIKRLSAGIGGNLIAYLQSKGLVSTK